MPALVTTVVEASYTILDISYSDRSMLIPKNVFLDVTPCGSYIVFLRRARRLLVTANFPSSPILVTLMKERLTSFETSVLTRATRRNIPEDDIFHSHRRKNLKSFIELTDWTV
jgi:hypothetical protein